jgi:hypothetical protein
METIGNVLLIVSALINLEVIYTYNRLTGGAWRDTSMGRHVMAYMTVTALILTLASIRFIVLWFDQSDPVWFQVLRAITYIALPIIFLWRRQIIVKVHRTHMKMEGEHTHER